MQYTNELTHINTITFQLKLSKYREAKKIGIKPKLAILQFKSFYNSKFVI